MAKKTSKHSAVHIVAAVIFALVALAHLVRVVGRIPVTFGNWSIAMWPSWVAIVIAVAMAVWLRKTAEN